MPRATPSGPEEASAASSGASSTSSPYTGDPGPAFDAGAAPGEVPGVEDAGPALPREKWEEEQVDEWLTAFGHGLHELVGVGERDWEMTETDLQRIVPAATRILNRYEPLRKAAEYSDAGMVAYGTGMYGWRSMLERQAVLRARARAEEMGEPIERHGTELEQLQEQPGFIPAAQVIREARKHTEREE
jgi:hypothetical protein